MIEVLESESPKYPPRTRHNAKTADLTVALAVDFNTAGEKLTHKAAGNKYVGIPLQISTLEAARMLFVALRKCQGKILNVAGNGIYTLATHGWTQESINVHLHAIVSKVHEHWPLTKVISGGQTGVDMAGVTAACALGIPVAVMLPSGFLQRGLNNVDRPQSEALVRGQIECGAQVLRQLSQTAV